MSRWVLGIEWAGEWVGGAVSRWCGRVGGCMGRFNECCSEGINFKAV